MNSIPSVRVAVVGSGISGLATAWLLQQRFDVTLFERNDYLGGHSHTVEVQSGSSRLAIDTGFMVFNRPNYPLLSALFDHLGVATYPTVMSFSASINGGELEYAGTNLDTLFAQRRNVLRPRYWALLREILRFNREASVSLRELSGGAASLGDWLDQRQFGADFRNDYLFPMAAAIWSCPKARMSAFPARSFLRFFHNHGLIKLRDRPQWCTLTGGSRAYVAKLRAAFRGRVVTENAVHAVARDARGVTLTSRDGETHVFEHVVLACHADESLALLSDASPDERAVLGAFRFQPNRVWLHRDPGLMPRRRKVWASWNYLEQARDSECSAVTVTYWMNALQALDTTDNYFVSLNPPVPPRADLVEAVMTYEHPVLDAGALRAQLEMGRLQGRANTWFAGAWTGYGFHEDGLRSGLEVAHALGGVSPPWDPSAIVASRALVARDEVLSLA
ncbi:MAG: NAD(P)/FAD-dependent oxidoreductase [Thiotrichales bacterium]